MSGWNLIAVPYSKRQDISRALRNHLSHDADQGECPLEIERLKGHDFLSLRLNAGEHAPRVFACYDRPLPTPDEPATFIISDGRWDLGIASEASRSAGGFTIAVECWPLLGRSGLAVFYAGVPVHFWSRDGSRKKSWTPRSVVEEVVEEFHSLLKQTMSLEGMLLHPMIRPARSTSIDMTRTLPRPRFDPCRPPETSPLHCAFYANVDERQMERALGNTPELIWSVSRTSMDVPYGVVVGMEPSRWEQWMEVQRRAHTQAMGLSLSGPSGSRWWSAGPDRLPLVGVARNIHDLLDRTGGFAEILDTNPADLRVPIATA